jgi:serine/threonine protein phosphatase 1
MESVKLPWRTPVELSNRVAYDKPVMKSFVIGDIHGCLEELASLIEHLPIEASDRLVFLGDYIDRGPDSNGVISYLIQLQRENNNEFVFLKGNHEDMFLSYLGLPGAHGDMFLYNGGRATLTSYGLSSQIRPSGESLSRIPPSHVEFLKQLQPYYLIEPFLCVHAGIHPLRSITEQKEEELLWIRNEFIFNRHRLPHTVLFGHTPQKQVLFDLPYKIGLDTGLVYGNKLSCLELNEKTLYQITRGSKKVKRNLIRDRWS